jgi:CheY-like chemotaxis protein
MSDSRRTPASVPPAGAPAPPPTMPLQETGHPYPVLIVNSDAALRCMLVCLLEEEGYEAASVAEGQECLAYLAAHRRPHIVMLYPRLYGMDGWEVLGYLRGNPPLRRRVSVLMMTASPDYDQPWLERYKRQIDGVVVLPFDSNRVVGLVAECEAKLVARRGPNAK